MCGIAGFAGTPQPDPSLLGRMAAQMVNRGPDGEGLWQDDVVGFAFRRLAIIDLHERSNQPMHLDSLHLVFNGEIYNYRELRDELRALGHEFRTEGDTEVLLHAWQQWDEGALLRFNGMFAFAIWDDRRRRLTLCSDAFGEKPLYYAIKPDGRLVFGSDIRALLQDPEIEAAPHTPTLELYLVRAAPAAVDQSFFAGIKRLPASQLLRWDESGAVSVERWWQPQRVEVPDRYEDATEHLRELLIDSIRLRLRSDVPIGTSLSGGIDSSSVVALSAELAGDHRRHTFTATFPGFENDEWRYASLAATQAGVVAHHAVEPGADGVLGELGQFVREQEEPVVSLSIYAQWCVNAAAREAGVVVLLDGQGGDELFAGYQVSTGYALRSMSAREALGELRRSPASARALAQSLAIDRLPGVVRRRYRRRTASTYASPELAARTSSEETGPFPPWSAEPDPLRRELLIESFATSLPQLLRYADRSSMARSREVRLPFLDRRVAEFALSLPARFDYHDGMTKQILRDAVREIVPAEVLARRDKVAFEPPQARWLAQPAFRERIAEVLLDPAARDRGLYDTEAIERDVAAGAWRDSGGIWRMLNCELWLRTLVEARPVA